ncbi:MAG: NfeD family protein [Bacteroidota bacterium]|nr:NfeD family protein [Bacteroidota bacterium]MDP4230662.1 NfeD family protein [Bacteroidota bacterium]MDP4235017.1 NfeD family protein [Bacteroidota bacterium]
MKHLIRSILLLGVLCTSLLHAQTKQRVHVIEISGEVDLGMASYVEHAALEAEKDNAVILLHVNTFGGRVDAATRIRDAIFNAKVPMTIAFVDKRAISAGSLITLSAKKIAMAPGATMGATTPVDQEGTKAPEKYVSYMRAEMRTTAERNGRDPRIAEAMVDESLGLDSISGFFLAKGKLLTLTTEDAMKVKYLDAESNSIDDVLKAFNIPNAEITTASETAGDKLIRFLTMPFVSSLLIMIGLAGLFYSIKTGHFGIVTIISVISLILFFGGQYITQVAPVVAIILFFAGIILFMLELTPIPTFGTAAILGVIGIFLGIFLALAGDISTLTPDRLRETTVTLATALIGLFILVGITFKYAPGWPWLKKFVNQTVSGNINHIIAEKKLLIGKEGTAITPLRPAGSALIDGNKVDVVTQGEFVLPGTSIIVVDTPANKVLVRTLHAQAKEEEQKNEGDPFGGRIPGHLETRV